MIDEGELDWKIVAISLDDPRAFIENDINDVEKHFAGMLTAIRDWFRDYKIPGKPATKFGLGNKAANKDYMLLNSSLRLMNLGLNLSRDRFLQESFHLCKYLVKKKKKSFHLCKCIGRLQVSVL